MGALQFQSLLGLPLLCALAWACGGCRPGVRPRVLAAGLLGQVLLGAALLHLPPLRAAFALVGDAVEALARATRAGTSLVFGYLGGAPLPFAETSPGASFILFFQALPLILVVGALSAVLYHWRVLPAVVALLARALGRLFGLSGACNLSVAANVFVGMVEAPLLIRHWLARLTRAELFVSMVAGLATISGNMLVVYAALIAPVVPDAAGQLLAASLISAPASILAALLMMPEREAHLPPEAEAAQPRLYDSTMDALVRGTADGLGLLLGIMASLIVFVALVALANAALEPLTGLTLQQVAGWLFWPLAWAMGVPAEECADGRAAARRQGGGERVRLLSGTGDERRRGALRALAAGADLCAVRLHQFQLRRHHGDGHGGVVPGAAGGDRGARPAEPRRREHRLLHERRHGGAPDAAA